VEFGGEMTRDLQLGTEVWIKNGNFGSKWPGTCNLEQKFGLKCGILR
jgi:hypothetical protein